MIFQPKFNEVLLLLRTNLHTVIILTLAAPTVLHKFVLLNYKFNLIHTIRDVYYFFRNEIFNKYKYLLRNLKGNTFLFNYYFYKF